MILDRKSSIRILHVVGGMPRAGTETWLMHVLRHIDRERFQMDFLVHTDQPNAYDEEIRSLGSRVIPCLNRLNPWLYARNFKQVLREHGPYDIVHSHVHHFSGYVLRLAKDSGVPIRIVHSHLDTLHLDSQSKLLRCAYLKLMTHWIASNSTFGLAASKSSAVAMFGSTWKTHPCRRILHCGIELAHFQDVINRDTVRSELNISADAFVIGHVGRFEEQKNHNFLVDIAAEVVKQEPRMQLLLVGDGSLRPDIEQKVTKLGLKDRVIFTGVRSDIARIMLGAMDVFLFPSLYEGLGLVLVEAQAAGLPCIFSDVIPEEADLITPLNQKLSLKESVSVWTEAILQAKRKKNSINQSDALDNISLSPFNIDRSVKELSHFYAFLAEKNMLVFNINVKDIFNTLLEM